MKTTLTVKSLICIPLGGQMLAPPLHANPRRQMVKYAMLRLFATVKGREEGLPMHMSPVLSTNPILGWLVKNSSNCATFSVTPIIQSQNVRTQ